MTDVLRFLLMISPLLALIALYLALVYFALPDLGDNHEA